MASYFDVGVDVNAADEGMDYYRQSGQHSFFKETSSSTSTGFCGSIGWGGCGLTGGDIWCGDSEKMNGKLSEILDSDQMSTRINLNIVNLLDNNGSDQIGKEGSMSMILGAAAAGWQGSSGESPIETSDSSFSNCSSPDATTVQKKFEYECVFCKGNNQPEHVYKSHPIRVDDTVMCPLLRCHVCGICGATGDNAHTVKYCPFNNRGFFGGYRNALPKPLSDSHAILQNFSTPMSMPFSSDNERYGMPIQKTKQEGWEAQPSASDEKTSHVRKLNFDEPLPISKSTPGFFKNLHQFRITNLNHSDETKNAAPKGINYWGK